MRKLFCFLCVVLFVLTTVLGAEESVVQSRARPFDLDVINTVHLAGSDEDSADFQTNELPNLMTLVNETLSERSVIDANTYPIDPTKLDLAVDSDVRVYFLGEGAGYHNTMGVSFDGTSLNGTDDHLIFPDASTRMSWYNGSTQGNRSNRYPLAAGDYVDLGMLSAGTSLDFFLIGNGANGGKNTYWTETEANRDNTPHVVALAPQSSDMLVIGFEDLWGGGDRDYNDLVFAVDIGSENLAALVHGDAPPWWVFAAIVCLGCVYFNRPRTTADHNA